MRIVGVGLGLMLAIALNGCSSLPKGKSVDYEHMPGSGNNMARGPGLINNHYSKESDGYLVYSDEAGSNPLIAAGSARDSADSLLPSSTTQSTAIRGKPNARANAQLTNQSESHSRPLAQRNTSEDQPKPAEYKQFREYQEFRRFQNMPRSTPARREFRQWQQWNDYRHWERSQHYKFDP